MLTLNVAARLQRILLMSVQLEVGNNNIWLVILEEYRTLWGEREQAMHYSIDCYVAKA